MTIKEVIASGKKTRRSSLNTPFGNVVQKDANVLEFVTPTFSVGLTMADVMAEDWEVEQAPRTFYIGMMKSTNYASGKETLYKIALETDKKPQGPTADNSPWIRVLEIKEDEESPV